MMKALEISQNVLQTFKMESTNLLKSEQTSGDFNKMFLEMQSNTQQKLDENKTSFTDNSINEQDSKETEFKSLETDNEEKVIQPEEDSETKVTDKDSKKSEAKSKETKSEDESSDKNKLSEKAKQSKKIETNDELKEDVVEVVDINKTADTDEKKLVIQKKLKELTSVNSAEELEEKLNELSELLSVSMEQLKDMLSKQNVNIDEVKAALEEGNSDSAKKQLLNMVLKLSEISLELEKGDTKNFAKKLKSAENKENLKANISEKVKEDISLKKTDLYEGNSKVESENSESLKGTEINLGKEGKIKLEKINPMKKFEPVNKKIQSKVIEAIKQSAEKVAENADLKVDTKVQAEPVKQISGQTNTANPIKSALSGNFQVNQSVNRLNTNTMKTEMIRNQLFKTGFDAGVKTAKTSFDKGTMKDSSNNQNTGQNFGMNSSKNFSQKLTNLVRTGNTSNTSYSSVQYKQTFEQMVKSVKFMNEVDKSQMEIRLKPGNLGNLKIDVTMNENGIVAKFVADNDQTRQIIESNISQLKAALEEQGLKIEGFEVSVRQESNPESQQKASDFNSKQRSKKLSSVNASSTNVEDLQVEQTAIKDYVDQRYSTVTYVA